MQNTIYPQFTTTPRKSPHLACVTDVQQADVLEADVPPKVIMKQSTEYFL